MTEPYIRTFKCLDVSTLHLHDELCNLPAHRWPIMAYEALEYGFIVHVPEEWDDVEHMFPSEISNDAVERLRSILDFARENGLEWVAFDIDAPVYDQFPKYE